MTEPINIRINVTQGSMEGLDALQRHLQELLGPGTRAGFRRQLNIAANITPGSTAGLDVAARRAGELSQQTLLGVARQAQPGTAPALQGLLLSAQQGRQPQAQPGTAQRGELAQHVQHVSTRIAHALVPGVHAGLQRLHTLGVQALRGQAGGQGRDDVRPPTPPIEAIDVRPGGVRPWPATLPASPFGPRAGGPPGTPAPPRLSTIERLGLAPRGPTPPGPPPPRPPGDAEDGEEEDQPRRSSRWGAAASTLLPGRWARFGMAGVAATVVLTAAQQARRGMELYEQTARGGLGVGQSLNLNFEETEAHLQGMRDRYQVLARDAVAAMAVFSRVTGGLPGVEAAVRTGIAYGLTPARAAALAGPLTRLTRPGPNPLATAVALGTMTGAVQPMAPEAVLEETTRLAGVGGVAAARVGVEMPARWMSLITSMGERYNVPGAASQFFGQFAAGVNQAPDATTQAIRIRALRSLARRQGPILKIGTEGEEVDLRTHTGLRIAMEQASQSPEILEAYRQTAGDLFGADPEQRELGFQAMVGSGLPLTESRRLRRAVERRGGFTGLGAPATGVTATEEQVVAERLRARRAEPGGRFVEAEARLEAAQEFVGRPLARAQAEAQIALGSLVQHLRTGAIGLDDVVKLLGQVADQTKALLDKVSAAAAAVPASGLAAFHGLFPPLGGAQPGFDVPYTDPFSAVPSRPGPSLLPQRPGP